MAKSRKEKKSSDLAQKIGAKLRALREQKGETLEGFANRNGMTMGQLGRYERGETEIQTDTLEKLIKHHNIGIKDFFGEGFQ